MTAATDAVRREAVRAANAWLDDLALEDAHPGAVIAYDGYIAGYLKGRADALAEVQACLRALPEGSAP